MLKKTLSLFCMFLLFLSSNATLASTFAFHLLREPHTLDPALVRGISGSYLFGNLFATLYRYDDQKGLIPELAKKCTWKNSKHLICILNSDYKWSDGKQIKAQDFVKGFKRLFLPHTPSTHTEYLLKLKNAKAILQNKKKVNTLGIEAKAKNQLHFYFQEEDGEFLYKLVNPALTAFRTDNLFSKDPVKLAFSGPFQIKKWNKGHWLELKPNSQYRREHPSQVNIKIYFVEEDSTALQLYQKGKLNFLRRISTPMIPKLKNRDDFFQKPIMRFDYIGFGSELAKHPQLRKALTLSLNFPELQKLYDAKGVPGCPSFPQSFLEKKLCYTFNLKEAKKALSQVPPKILNRQWMISFNQLGGDSVQIGMEWMQNQWKKHLGLNIKLQAEESGEMFQKLKSMTMPLFRKGMYLSRPSCLAALENFSSTSEENYINFKNKKFDSLLQDLNRAQTGSLKEKLCYEALNLIFNEYAFIPLGEIHYSMLKDDKFVNWQINSLNQLYLANIKSRPVSK